MSEKDEAKKLGLKLVKNSGRNMYKGDMRRGRELLIDLKEVSKSFTISPSIWSKICTDASTYGYETVPMLIIKFTSGIKLAIIDYDDIGRLNNE